tara:strand:+ start:13522 stop:13695 length:174 start_codon:yes stop_codon:yes gene_type:complete
VAKFAGALVAVMALSYVTCVVVILLINVSQIILALTTIIEQSFSLTSLQGRFAGPRC